MDEALDEKVLRESIEQLAADGNKVVFIRVVDALALLARLAEAEKRAENAAAMSDEAAFRAGDAESRLAEAEKERDECHGAMRRLEFRYKERAEAAEAQITTLKETIEQDRVEAYGRGFQDGQTAKEAEIGFIMDAVMGRD